MFTKYTNGRTAWLKADQAEVIVARLRELKRAHDLLGAELEALMEAVQRRRVKDDTDAPIDPAWRTSPTGWVTEAGIEEIERRCALGQKNDRIGAATGLDPSTVSKYRRFWLKKIGTDEEEDDETA
jgi:hypothetical protein